MVPDQRTSPTIGMLLPDSKTSGLRYGANVELGTLDLALRQIEAAGDTGAVRERFRAFIAAHPDALWRTCRLGHLTASALVVDRDDRVLLLHHAKLERWLQPGGHADGDGDLARVALKEATEETGLIGLRVVTPAVDLDIHWIPERGDEPAHEHFDVRFLVECDDPGSLEPNHESTDTAWLDPSDPTLDGDLRRLVDAALSRRRSGGHTTASG